MECIINTSIVCLYFSPVRLQSWPFHLWILQDDGTCCTAFCTQR